jgi:sugar-specific transcriptional regulator TrmB
VLEKLSEKGWAEIQQGRPVLFKAVAPSKIIGEIEKENANELKKSKDLAVKELEALRGKKTAEAIPALIWGVRGYAGVMAKIIEITKRSKKEILLNIPDLSTLSADAFAELQNAKERGIIIKIATENKGDLKKYRNIALIRVREKIHGIDIIGDEREVLVAPGLPIFAAWLDNPEMALHVKDFLELVWKDAKVLK